MDQIINVVVTVTLFEMMVTIGLGVSFADVVGVARNLRLVARAALANYVIVPMVAVALLLSFHAHPMVAAGFIIAAACPGAPYGPPFTAMAKGDVSVSVGLMVILAGSSVIITPILLQVLLPFASGNEPLKVNVVRMASILIANQLLPLCIGLYLRARRPALAERLMKPLSRLSMLLNLLTLGLILGLHFRMLWDIRLMAYLGMSALVAASLVAGWLFGGPESDKRTAMVFATSVRNVAVSLVIATGSFPGTPAITAVTAFAIFQTVVIAVVAMGWGKYARARAGTT